MIKFKNLRLVFLFTLFVMTVLTYELTLSARASELRGDVNHNDILDSRDAMIVQRYCLGLITLDDSDINLADYNYDYKVTSKDVLSIMRTVIGIDSVNNETYVSDEEFVNEVLRLVNEERKKEGLPLLVLDRDLCNVAQLRSDETVESFSHTRPNDTPWHTALKEAGITYRFAGENIAAGQSTPEKVVNSWMNSEGHRKNIMSEDYKKIGIGYTYADGTTFTHYWSQIFTD